MDPQGDGDDNCSREGSVSSEGDPWTFVESQGSPSEIYKYDPSDSEDGSIEVILIDTSTEGYSSSIHLDQNSLEDDTDRNLSLQEHHEETEHGTDVFFNPLMGVKEVIEGIQENSETIAVADGQSSCEKTTNEGALSEAELRTDDSGIAELTILSNHSPSRSYTPTAEIKSYSTDQISSSDFLQSTLPEMETIPAVFNIGLQEEEKIAGEELMNSAYMDDASSVSSSFDHPSRFEIEDLMPGNQNGESTPLLDSSTSQVNKILKFSSEQDDLKLKENFVNHVNKEEIGSVSSDVELLLATAFEMEISSKNKDEESVLQPTSIETATETSGVDLAATPGGPLVRERQQTDEELVDLANKKDESHVLSPLNLSSCSEIDDLAPENQVEESPPKTTLVDSITPMCQNLEATAEGVLEREESRPDGEFLNSTSAEDGKSPSETEDISFGNEVEEENSSIAFSSDAIAKRSFNREPFEDEHHSSSEDESLPSSEAEDNIDEWEFNLGNSDSTSTISSVSSSPQHQVFLRQGQPIAKPDLLEEANRIEEFDQVDLSSLTNQDLPPDLHLATINRERHYIHHPNRRLNMVLSLAMAFSLAGVVGFGLGHFIGLSDNFPPRPGCGAPQPEGHGTPDRFAGWRESDWRAEVNRLQDVADEAVQALQIQMEKGQWQGRNELIAENFDLKHTIGRMRYGKPVRSIEDRDTINRLETENQELRAQVGKMRYRCAHPSDLAQSHVLRTLNVTEHLNKFISDHIGGDKKTHHVTERVNRLRKSAASLMGIIETRWNELNATSIIEGETKNKAVLEEFFITIINFAGEVVSSRNEVTPVDATQTQKTWPDSVDQMQMNIENPWDDFQRKANSETTSNPQPKLNEDWFLLMGQERDKARKTKHRSDWLFERAKTRELGRDEISTRDKRKEAKKYDDFGKNRHSPSKLYRENQRNHFSQ